jgi:hypothetical protein
MERIVAAHLHGAQAIGLIYHTAIDLEFYFPTLVKQVVCMFKLVAALMFAASLAAFAQMDMKPSGHQSTNKEKIADALRAGPPFIVKDAAIADWPADPKAPNAEYRVLRAGKSD